VAGNLGGLYLDDEILFQGPGFTIARSHVPGTLVPYASANRADGNVNHGWLDLRGRPDLVSQIPEARKSAGLTKLLEAIAQPSSELMSSGCECAAFDHGEEAPNSRWHVGGFVDVMFKDAERNRDPESLVTLARRLLAGVRGSEEHHFGFEMIVEPLKAFFGHDGCHALMAKPIGYGPDEQKAWTNFNFAASALADAVTALR